MAFLLGALDDQPHQYASTKCNTCKTVTPHDWIPVVPNGTKEDANSPKILENARRLIICNTCGTLSLKK